VAHRQDYTLIVPTIEVYHDIAERRRGNPQPEMSPVSRTRARGAEEARATYARGARGRKPGWWIGGLAGVSGGRPRAAQLGARRPL